MDTNLQEKSIHNFKIKCNNIFHLYICNKNDVSFLNHIVIAICFLENLSQKISIKIIIFFRKSLFPIKAFFVLSLCIPSVQFLCIFSYYFTLSISERLNNLPKSNDQPAFISATIIGWQLWRYEFTYIIKASIVCKKCLIWRLYLPHIEGNTLFLAILSSIARLRSR